MSLQNDPPSFHYVRISRGALTRNGQLLADSLGDASEGYRALGSIYPKFFKMDSLSKWAWLGAEALLFDGDDRCLYDGLDKRRIAVVMHTTDGCLEVDKRYAETLQTIPSPALFVYTLPNIMLGEICIRHGFTGQQLCQVTEGFDAAELYGQASDLLLRRDTTHCLFGKVDALDDRHDVILFWADAVGIKLLNPEKMQEIYSI